MIALLVEFAQNALMGSLWCTGIWLWIKHQNRLSKALTIVCFLAMGVIGPLFLHATEPLIEPRASVEGLGWNDVANVVSLTMFAFLALFYFAARWSSWRSDLGIGAAIGLVMSVAQGVTLPDVPVVRLVWHGIAMVLVLPILLIGIRSALNRAQAWWQFLLLVSVVILVASVFIIVVDYGIGGAMAGGGVGW